MITHQGTKLIKTERLILRRFEYSDCQDMLKYWVNDPKVQSLYCEPVYATEQAVTELLDKYIGGANELDYYRWAIELNETKECIGQIAYFMVSEDNHFAEIEYCLGAQFHNQGLGTEATQAVIKYGFDQMNLNKVQICHKSSNMPSKRVIEKCGLSYEGTLRDFFYEDGAYIDRLYYSILRSEYEALAM